MHSSFLRPGLANEKQSLWLKKNFSMPVCDRLLNFDHSPVVWLSMSQCRHGYLTRFVFGEACLAFAIVSVFFVARSVVAFFAYSLCLFCVVPSFCLFEALLAKALF